MKLRITSSFVGHEVDGAACRHNSTDRWSCRQESNAPVRCGRTTVADDCVARVVPMGDGGRMCRGHHDGEPMVALDNWAKKSRRRFRSALAIVVCRFGAGAITDEIPLELTDTDVIVPSDPAIFPKASQRLGTLIRERCACRSVCALSCSCGSSPERRKMTDAATAGSFGKAIGREVLELQRMGNGASIGLLTRMVVFRPSTEDMACPSPGCRRITSG
jgi:hypothetical protein